MQKEIRLAIAKVDIKPANPDFKPTSDWPELVFGQGGFKRGESLVIIGGRTNVGKSVFHEEVQHRVEKR